MHRLLARQIQHTIGTQDGLTGEVKRLLDRVDATYAQADEDRALVERSLHLMDRELKDRNEALDGRLRTVLAMERLAHEREQVLRRVLDSAPSMIGVVEILREDLRFREANPALDAFLGCAAVGHTLGELGWPAEAIDRWRALLVQRRGASREEHHLPTRDGTRWIALATAEVHFAGRTCTLVVMDDVTERKAAEARLELADRLVSLGRVTAGVAHEIHNPLTHLLANLELLDEGLEQLDAAALRDLVREARGAAERVRGITRDLKQLSRPDEETKRRVPLAEVVDAALRVVEHDLRHRARVVTDHEPCPPVRCNPARLGQVFVNLLVNAAQAIPPGRAADHRITVRTRARSPSVVCVEVEDTGCGIPDSALPHLFDPFFTTKPIGVGSGLGLAICRDIVQASQGTIEVVSRVGEGTRFVVELPAAPPSAAPTPPPAPARAPAPTRRARLLVVDDEWAIGRSLQRLLTEHTVVAVTSAAKALELLDGGDPFDLVLADLMMPTMTGLELRSELCRRRSPLAHRFVLLTGALAQAEESPSGEPPVPVLEKPFETAHLRSLIAEMLSRPGGAGVYVEATTA